MPVNRLAVLTDWVEHIITDTARMQGWDPDWFEFSIRFDVTQTRTGSAGVTWLVLMNVDSALVGKPPLGRWVRLAGERPEQDYVAGQVVDTLNKLWTDRIAALRPAKPPQFPQPPILANGHKPILLPGS
jgi:hypothetical protein